MFRRREDSLFDNTIDPHHPESAEMASSGSPSSAASTPSSSSSTSNNSAASSSQPAYLQNAAPAAQAPASRSAESRPAAPQPANSFRPAAQPASAPITSDLSRNRMPEPKATPSTPPSSSAHSPASASSLSSFSGNNSAKNSGKRVLTVGNDILLKGEIATCDRLVIEGRVDATLNDVHTVEIAETGSFKGSAHIEDAEISGLFEGDLIVRNRLVIYATGKVRGKITYGEIEIERGGEISGEIKTNHNDSVTATARPARHKEERVAA